MFRARNRSETPSRPTTVRGSVGSARVWDARTRALRAAGKSEVPSLPAVASEDAPPLELAPAELSALIAGIVAVTLDTRLADCEPARRALVARELETRLALLFRAPLPEAPRAEPAPAVRMPEVSAPEEAAPAAEPVAPEPLVPAGASPTARALGLVLEDRLNGLGGTLSERADLRRRLIALALATVEDAPPDDGPPASSDELRSLDVLQRRTAKLERSLAESRSALAYVSGLEHVDEGLASIYRTVQGLAPSDPRHTQKREVLEGIFRANLELQKPAE